MTREEARVRPSALLFVPLAGLLALRVAIAVLEPPARASDPVPSVRPSDPPALR